MKLLISSILSILLISCSSQPTHIIISPDFITPSHHKYVNKSVQLSVQDLRTSQHLVQILQKDKAAKLVNSQDDLANIIAMNLKQQFTKQGLGINSFGKNNLSISIDSALITVHQSITRYQSTTEITLLATLQSGDTTLTKTYKIKGAGKGPLDADIAVLGRDFNQYLAKLLSQIINDTEVQQTIK